MQRLHAGVSPMSDCIKTGVGNMASKKIIRIHLRTISELSRWGF
ncbi:hypothetical protein [Moorena producens]